MTKFSDLFSFTRSEVRFAFNNATKIASTAGLTLLQAPQQHKLSFGKLLIVVPKKVGTAIVRNLIRRRVKAIFYEEKLFEKPVLSILLIRPPAVNLSFVQLKDFLKTNIP